MWLQNRADVTCSGAQQALGTCTVPQVQEPTSLQTVLPWVKPSWFETSCQLYVGKVSVLDHSVLQTVSHKLKTGPSPKRRWHSAGGLLISGKRQATRPTDLDSISQLQGKARPPQLLCMAQCSFFQQDPYCPVSQNKHKGSG